MSKTIQTRIQQKHDIEANWIKANNSATPFIPLKGELIIYDVEVDNNGATLDLTGTGRTAPITYERFKIGDGKTTVSNLPFADKAAKDYTDSVGDAKVPNTRKVNNKALSADITLSAADVKMTDYSKASSASAVSTSDTINAAIGKLEKALDGKQASGSYLTAHQTVKQDGVTGATVNRFGTCSTAAATAAKTVSITTGTFNLETGAKVSVKFSNANTASTPTLNVNGKGAKKIFHKGTQITSGSNKALLAGVCDFVYDGTQWHLVGNYIDTDTNTDTKVTAVGNHYTPAADSTAELTASLSETAGAYAKDTEYTVLTGVKAQRDAKGHVTGITYTAQKIKDTNTTYTIPTALKNPNALTIKANSDSNGLVVYDGSAAKTFIIKPSETAGAFIISDGTTEKTIQLAGKFTDNNTTYSVVTAAKDGLMSKTDKSNLDTLVAAWTADGTDDTLINKIQEVLTAFENAPEGTNIVVALAGKSDVGHTHEVTTANAAPHTHTHNVTVSGTTGANSGTAVAAVTGVGANGTATVLTGVKASSTDTFLKTVAEGSGSLEAYDTATGGTKKVSDGTRIPFVTSLSKAGYTPAGSVTLTNGTAPSFNPDTGANTDTPYISSLTKGDYTPAGSVSLTPGTAPSMGNATIKYLSASASGAAVGANGTGSVAPSGHTHTVTVSGTTGANSGTAVKAVTGYGSFSGGSLTGTKTFNTDAIKSIGGTRNYGFSASTSNVMTAPTVTNGVLSFTLVNAATQDAHTGTAASTGTVGFTAASLGTASTSDVAPAAHTHSYGSSTALTTSGNSGTAVTALTGVKVTTQPTITLTADTSTATGRIKYVEAQGTFTAGTTPKSSASFSGTKTNALVTDGTTKYMKFSAGTTPKSSASFTGTNSTAVVTGGTTHYLEHTHTASTEGTTASAVTAVAANGTATALTGVKATGTANVAPSGHTHSYGSSTALTTGNNSGNAVAAVTSVAASED